MDLIAQIFIVIGFFLVLKAIEYHPTPTGLYQGCSIGAWIAFGVGLVLWIIQ